jgi:uncharacterized protein (TIGR03083 family)
MDRSVVSVLADEWGAIADLVAGLDEKDWDLPTDCPGWTVRDQVSHVIGVESMLLGRPAPPAVDPASAPHARDSMGLLNESWVAPRRGRSPAEMMAELEEVTTARRQAMEAMTDEELAKPTNSPIGEVPYAEFMLVRVMDCWVHEQDIRRAVGRPGGFDGSQRAEIGLGRLTGALGFVVGKRAGAPEGTSVVVDLEGPMARTFAVTVSDGRARPTSPPAQPTVRLAMSAETYLCLSTGRWSSDDVVAAGHVAIEGDTDLGRHILEAMAII